MFKFLVVFFSLKSTCNVALFLSLLTFRGKLFYGNRNILLLIFSVFPSSIKTTWSFYAKKKHFLQYFVINIYVYEMEYIWPE